MFTENIEIFEELNVPIFNDELLTNSVVTHRKLCASSKCPQAPECTRCIFFGMNEEKFNEWLKTKIN